METNKRRQGNWGKGDSKSGESYKHHLTRAYKGDRKNKMKKLQKKRKKQDTQDEIRATR